MGLGALVQEKYAELSGKGRKSVELEIKGEPRFDFGVFGKGDDYQLIISYQSPNKDINGLADYLKGLQLQQPTDSSFLFVRLTDGATLGLSYDYKKKLGRHHEIELVTKDVGAKEVVHRETVDRFNGVIGATYGLDLIKLSNINGKAPSGITVISAQSGLKYGSKPHKEAFKVIQKARSHLSEEDIKALRNYRHELVDKLPEMGFLKMHVLQEGDQIPVDSFIDIVRNIPNYVACVNLSFVSDKIISLGIDDFQNQRGYHSVEIQDRGPLQRFSNALDHSWSRYSQITGTSLQEIANKVKAEMLR